MACDHPFNVSKMCSRYSASFSFLKLPEAVYRVCHCTSCDIELLLDWKKRRCEFSSVIWSPLCVCSFSTLSAYVLSLFSGLSEQIFVCHCRCSKMSRTVLCATTTRRVNSPARVGTRVPTSSLRFRNTTQGDLHFSFNMKVILMAFLDF